jgi:hypothetical protein
MIKSDSANDFIYWSFGKKLLQIRFNQIFWIEPSVIGFSTNEE